MKKSFSIRQGIVALSMYVVSVLVSSSAYAYPLAQVTNKTQFWASGTVEYVDPFGLFCSDDSYRVAPGETWTASTRGDCLIDGITSRLDNGASVVSYSSTGTSYSQFLIQPTSAGYRVYSKQEYANHTDDSSSQGPGFYIRNNTDWPLAISLDQVGCLYHDVVYPGEVFKRETGSVWFTIGVNIQPDGAVRSDWDCVKPVAKIVGAVLLAAASGGYGGFAAIPASVGTTVASVSFSVSSAVIAGLSTASSQIAGRLLTDNGELTLKSQYAGYEWPFRCDKMPEYEISGGPSLKFANGQGVIGMGTKLTIKKTNDCGNNMMAGASTSASTSPSIPWDLDLATQLSAANQPVQWCDRLLVDGPYAQGEFWLNWYLNGAPLYWQETTPRQWKKMYKRNIPQSWDASHTGYWVISDHQTHTPDGDWAGILTYAHNPTLRAEDPTATWAGTTVSCVGNMVTVPTN